MYMWVIYREFCRLRVYKRMQNGKQEYIGRMLGVLCLDFASRKRVQIRIYKRVPLE